MTDNRSPLDIAADLLVYAPVGLAVQLGRQLPELAQAGRNQLETTLMAAKVVGRLSVSQGRRELNDRIHKMTESPPQSSSPTPSPKTTEAKPQRHGTMSSETANPSGQTSVQTSVQTGRHASGDASTLAIEGYTSLSATQIIAHLPALGSGDLAAIAAYEAANRQRKSVLARIEQLQSQYAASPHPQSDEYGEEAGLPSRTGE